ncbi:putative diacylglycerol O-acyltransferase MT1468 [Oratosquilla oratoria]|uniref:putative diacylglycerol O-acyltransferase MT1468 n=1 Tax=Oratosquilla oratoria TaxID=337810 RepID=UPI003F761994
MAVHSLLPLNHDTHAWAIWNSTLETNGSLTWDLPPPGDEKYQILWSAERLFSGWPDYVSSDRGILTVAIALAVVLLRASNTKTIPSPSCIPVLQKVLTSMYLVCKAILGLAILTVSFPLAVVIILFFGLLSLAVSAVYFLRWGHTVTKAEGMDAMWGLEVEESRPIITACVTLKGTADIEKIRESVLQKIVFAQNDSGAYKYPKFSQEFVSLVGYKAWRDVDVFDIANHIYVLKESEKNGFSSDMSSQKLISKSKEEAEEEEEEEERINRIISNISSGPLPASCPPWQMLVIPRKDARYALVLRLHHALGDGIALVRTCLESLVDEPLHLPKFSFPRLTLLQRVLLGTWSTCFLPYGLLSVLTSRDNNALHGPQLSGIKVMKTSRAIPLTLLKEVKNSTFTTINDVLMSCLSAAISKFLQKRPRCPSNILMAVPVTFQSPDSMTSIRNQFSAAIVSMNMARRTPDQRLYDTMKQMLYMKRDPTLLALYWTLRGVSSLLPSALAEIVLKGDGVTLVASNVPGPLTPITLWKDKVIDIAFWIPHRSHVGLGISFLSYQGNVKVGINIDRALVENPEEAKQILDNMELELQKLHKSVTSQL